VHVGSHAPDFSFVGENGKVETFGLVRGVVTLVVFPNMPEWPDCQRCKEIVKLADEVNGPNTPVAVVSVATPRQGEKSLAALHRCQIKGSSQLIGLHDRQGRVRGLYGDDAEGRFFVVDRAGSITAIGFLVDSAAMREALRSAVNEHEEYWRQLNDHTGG
jgi:hypothetical protein